MENYVSKAVTTAIKATSRASVKVKDSYYTVEFTEERLIPNSDDVNVEEERKLLWDIVNNEVDNQIEEIVSIFTK